MGDARRDAGALSASLAARRVELPRDPETEAWRAANARPHAAPIALAHAVLRRFASDYDVDGWLGTHPMHVLGTASWRALVGGDRIGGSLLDVGAGRGDVTATLAPLVDRVTATETSAPMVRRLRARGYQAHRIDLAVEPLPGSPRFDAVALLHVLDRCARPRSLLRAAVASMAEGAIAIVACPLPARPHVDVGGHTVDPDEPLGIEGEDFESALASLASLLAREGLEIERWARATYLARGGQALDDAIVIARRARGSLTPRRSRSSGRRPRGRARGSTRRGS